MSVEIGRGHSVAIAAGGIAALLGLYWDDAWHTDVGRDTFFAPPHLLLYAGVGVLLAAAASWTFRRYRIEGGAVLRDPTVVLPLLGAAVTLGAAPVDELWHQLFGRDAVTWSPPHMVAVAGMAAFAAGLLLAVCRPEGRSPRIVSAAVGAFVIAAMVTVVMEFETDVPQFPIGLYVPVTVAALTFAFALIHRSAPVPWAVTTAAAVYVGLRVGVVGFLAALGHSLPTVMPTVAAAAAFDVAMRRGWGRWPAAAATTAAIVGSHVTAHRLQPAGLELTAVEVALGALAGVVLAAGVLAVVGVASRAGAPRPRPRRSVPAAAALVGMFLLVSASPAFAHDPGQGQEISPVVLHAVRHDDRVQVQAVGPDGACPEWEAVGVVARRAGRTRTGPLVFLGACRFAGAVTIDDPGRWFVYTEFTIDGRAGEAWLPVEDGTHRKDTVVYAASGEGPHLPQVVAGAVLYTVVVAIFAGIVLAYRRSGPSAAADRGRGAAEGVAVGAR